MPVTIPAPGASSSYMPAGGERAQLEEGGARVEQAVDPLADRQLAALAVPGDRGVVAAGAATRHRCLAGAQVRDEGGHRFDVRARVGAGWVEPTPEDGHGRMIRGRRPPAGSGFSTSRPLSEPGLAPRRRPLRARR